MARLIKNRRCVLCGKNNVYMWTIDNMQKVVVTYLCKDHSGLLLDIMNAAGTLPPNEQIPVPDRADGPPGYLDVHKRGRREVPMRPLLNWTPPPASLPPEKPKVAGEEVSLD